MPLKDMQSGNAIGFFRDLISSGGCVLGCVSTFNEEPVGITLSLSFGYDEKTGTITGVGITPSIDSRAMFIGPNPAPQRAAAMPLPGMGPTPEILGVRIDSSVLRGLSGAQLSALDKATSNKRDPLNAAIQAAVAAEEQRRAEEQRKKEEEKRRKNCAKDKLDCA